MFGRNSSIYLRVLAIVMGVRADLIGVKQGGAAMRELDMGTGEDVMHTLNDWNNTTS